MLNLDVIEGTQYSCKSDKAIIDRKKTILDYHTKNIGNLAKSTVTPAQLKLIEVEYEALKKKYDESFCGKDPETDACIALQGRITSMQSTITYFLSIRDNESAKLRATQLEAMIKEFDDSKCGEKVGGFRAGVVRSISETFQALDKARIEEESKYRAKQKIFFGAIILIGAVLMITMFGKRE
jgi:hypothetical protein